MPKLPALRGNEVIRVLGKVGFQVIRQKGSHVRMKHEDGRVVTIPVHAGKTIGIGLLAQDTTWCWTDTRGVYRIARIRRMSDRSYRCWSREVRPTFSAALILMSGEGSERVVTAWWGRLWLTQIVSTFLVLWDYSAGQLCYLRLQIQSVLL